MSVRIPGQERFGAVRRIVVVDHTKPAERGGGRIFDMTDVEAELVFQDSHTTCKIFLTRRAASFL